MIDSIRVAGQDCLRANPAFALGGLRVPAHDKKERPRMDPGLSRVTNLTGRDKVN